MSYEKSVKKVLSVLLAAVMMLALPGVMPVSERAYAECYSEDGWEYDIVSGGVDIISYSGLDENLIVPAKIAGKNVYSVSGLYTPGAKSRVRSITVSKGIKVIGDMVFSEYVNLERVTLPDTLTSIGKDAFYNCSKLRAITLPNLVTSIGSGAFTGCSSLTSANLTSQIKELPDKVFQDCSSLAALTLPPYLTSIGDYAFQNCSSLKNVFLPNTVQSLGMCSFQNCISINTVNMPVDLKTIGASAFDGCTGIGSVFLPGKVKSVAENAFRGCTGLTDAYVSSSVNIIEKNSFSGCVSLKTAVFGGNYVNLNNVFDVMSIPMVYYPSNATGWENYGDKKTSYPGTTSVKITGSTKLKPGKSAKLTVSVSPRSEEFDDVYYLTSSNTSVVSVAQDGTVSAKAAGAAVISATALNGKVNTVTITVAPETPRSLKVSAKSTSSAELSWEGNSSGYIVYRASSKKGTYKKIGTVLSTSYIDKGLTKGKTYYYKVASYVNSEQKQVTSDKTSAVSVTVTSPAPSTVSAKKSKAGVASISWSKSVGASGYEVYMASSKSGKYSKIATITSASTLTCKKTGLKKNKTYYFKVRSYVTVGGSKKYSGFSKVVKAKV